MHLDRPLPRRRTEPWLSSRKVLVSPTAVQGLDPTAERVETTLTCRQVEESPAIDTAKPVSRQHDTALSAHYGFSPCWTGPYRWDRMPTRTPCSRPACRLPTLPPYENRVGEEMAARERQSQDPHLRSAAAVTGYGIRATDGELGHVEDFLVDEQDWAIRYLVVDPRSCGPGRHVVIATDWIRSVSWDDSVVEVDVTRDAVRAAPRYEPGAALTRDDETRLYAHHRRPGYWVRRPDAA
jgi:hypothetical protein